MKGTVKFFDSQRGWGFITDSEGKDVFAHHSNIIMDHFRTLHEDDIVTFELGAGNDEREQAVNIIPVLTMKMIEKSLEKDNLYIRPVTNALGVKGYMVVDQNNIIQTSEQGVSFLELAAYAGFDTEDLSA